VVWDAGEALSLGSLGNDSVTPPPLAKLEEVAGETEVWGCLHRLWGFCCSDSFPQHLLSLFLDAADTQDSDSVRGRAGDGE